VMTPMGAAVLQTATAAGIGAGTGALMHGANPVAIGAVSAGAGSVGSQVINSFVPQAGNAPQYNNGGGGYPNPQQRYQQLPNGSFVPVN
jgi:hypothetical protein